MKKIVCLFLSIIILLGIMTACGAPAPIPVKVLNTDISVWYVDDKNPMWKNFRTMVQDYNADSGKAVGVKVTAKAFDDDAKLLSELERADSKPSIVICGHNAAMTLGTDAVPTYTDLYFSTIGLSGLIDSYTQAGRLDGKLIAVPLAAAASVIMVNTAAAKKAPDYSDKVFASPESICSVAVKYADLTGSHFFTSDSFASLFSIGLAQLGGEFHAQKELDIEDENYAYLYNLLAEAAYDGGVTASGEKSVSLVASGTIASAVVSTADVMADESELDGVETAFYPCPVAENGKALHTMDLTEMLITCNDALEQEAAAGFMSWLISCSYKLTDGTGYYPAAANISSTVMGGDTGSALYKSMTAAVKKSAQKCSLYFPAADAEYYSHCLEFESNFRDTLSGLN